MKNKYLVSSFALFFIIIGGVYFVLYDKNTAGEKPAVGEYNPLINPSDFSIHITNKYFSLPINRTFIYEGQAADGIERVEIIIYGYTKEIMGVQTLVYQDKVYLDGQLTEDTRDYLAQDKDGNVWYFGEDVDNYEDSTLKDHKGSWIAGVDGAKPGIWMKANPQVGDTYRQEYYKGEAEDMADVLSISETVVTKRATYHDCLKTYDYTPLDPAAKEHKYYCPEVAGLVLEVNITDGERVELVEVKKLTTGTRQDISGPYQDPHYCETDSDCAFFITSDCCTPGVINKYHDPENFPIVQRTCEAVCDINVGWVRYCNIEKNGKGWCNAREPKK